MTITKEHFLAEFADALADNYSVTPREASVWQIHNALSSVIMGNFSGEIRNSREQHLTSRRACYFSAEFLVGRAVYNNLLCLGLTELVETALQECGLSLAALEDIEDAALGNGGLGRLAACFLDSAATLNLPLDGYGIRYRYGLFKQDIRNGCQVEEADDWARYGDPWSRRREGETVLVEFSDQTVRAVPYDMPVFGFRTKNSGNLRLWQAESIHPFNFPLFNDQKYDAAVADKNRAEDISRVLYPNDTTHEGRLLRLKQQYFFCCASITDIIRKFKKYHGSDFSKLPDYITIQLNDTHPVISIPELIRQVELEGVPFAEALALSKRIFNYTNHTIMAEALEKWPLSLINEILPKIGELIQKISAAMETEMTEKGIPAEKLAAMRIIDNDMAHMARLAVYVSKNTNGVARIHTEILKESLFRDWYELYPDRFKNMTNGVTQRRWLALCNQELTALLTEKLGHDRFLTDLRELKPLLPLADDTDTIARFAEIKHQKKVQLAEYVFHHDGKRIDPNTIFDVQVKRLHEYKRQLLNAFSILYLYYGIKEGSIQDFYPTTFLFAAKSAPGYFRAKGIIQYINQVAELVNNDPDTCGILRVEFLKDYNVSYAEKIVAGADVSVQISTAGTEASGTGNMKLMLNGAVTLGTLDGANIEIVDEAGAENNYIFGAKVEDLAEIMPGYSPAALYDSDEKLRRVVDSLINGVFTDGGSGVFQDLYNSLLNGSDWERPDKYYLLGDLNSLIEARLRLNADYKDREGFAKKCFANTCCSGRFSSDRTIRHYAGDIWELSPLPCE